MEEEEEEEEEERGDRVLDRMGEGARSEKGMHECGVSVEPVVKGGMWLLGRSRFTLLWAQRTLCDCRAHAV